MTFAGLKNDSPLILLAIGMVLFLIIPMFMTYVDMDISRETSTFLMVLGFVFIVIGLVLVYKDYVRLDSERDREHAEEIARLKAKHEQEKSEIFEHYMFGKPWRK